MFRFTAALAVALTCILLMRSNAQAHVVCGDRIFLSTLTMDDPGTGDEFSLPALGFTPNAGGGTSNSYAFEWDKSITEDLTVAINDDYISQHSPGSSAQGWDNATVTIKDQHPCMNERPHEEWVWSVGLVRELPGTGSKTLSNSGVIDTFGSTAPTFYFGKGLGDLSSSALRPIAITGELSRDIPDAQALSPNRWSYAASIQYSIPYYEQNIKALHAPPWVTRLTPVVEYSMTTPDLGTPTGTISPGLFYDAPSWQVAAEATIPANKATWQNQGIGFIVEYHVFLDTYYKSWFGRPIINTNLWGKQ